MKNLEARPRQSEHLLFIEDENQPVSQPSLLDRARDIWSQYYWRIIIFAIAFVLFYYFIIRSGFLTHSIKALNAYLESVYRTHPIFVTLILFLMITSVEIFCYFSHAAMCILAAAIMKNFYLSVFILLSGSLLGSALIYYFSHHFCREWILSKLEKNDFFVVLQEESHHHPYKTAFLTRLLFIPAGVKDYILTTIDNPAESYFVSGAAVHSFYIIESCLVASVGGEMFDHHSKPWREKSGIEKFSFVMVTAVLVFTIIFLIVLGRWATQRIKERKRQMDIELTNTMALNNIR